MRGTADADRARLRWLAPATAMISAAAIGYELLLMRLLSIVHWHHFAYMIISLALLGYGVSGTLVALTHRRLARRFAASYAASAIGCGIAMPVCFALGQRIPFNALEMMWEPRQLLWLSALYLLFFIPFLLAATCIGLALTCFSASAGRLYAFDLTGAGCGALLIVAALFVLAPQDGLRLLSALAFCAAFLACAMTLRRGARLAAGAAVAATVVAALALLPGNWLSLRPSPFKGLSQALAVIDAELLGEYSSPLGQLSVVASPTVPFRHVPGLSLNAEHGPPEQLAVFTDGDAMSVITRHDGTLPPLSYLDATTGAAPYHLLRAPRVLILGAGGGQEVLLARYHAARSIDAVELNPLMVNLLTGPHADFAGDLYRGADLRVHIGEARAFVAQTAARFDLIQMALLDSAAAAGAGVHALSETYLYTVEALEAYLTRLTPGGVLAITRWLKLPPRDSVKLFATAVEALERRGVAKPGQHLALIRGWNTTTLLVGERAFSTAAVDALREFTRARSFDIAHAPGMDRAEANRYNVLREAYFHDAATQLLEDRDAFLSRYKFDVTPATDDSPYFFNFLKWRVLPELLAVRHRGGAALIEWGYLVVVATLGQALIAGSVLILLPLASVGRTSFESGGARMSGYFFALGLAFLFVEIAFIQKLVLFLGHPLYAVAVVLSGFLVFAGIGSAVVSRGVAGTTRTRGVMPSVPRAVAGIIVLCATYLLLTPTVLPLLIGLSDTLKVLVALALIAPLAFCMGMPFPLGLVRVHARAPAFVPWAWGINGFASVLSAALATLLAVELGFTAVVALGGALYAIAALLRPR